MKELFFDLLACIFFKAPQNNELYSIQSNFLFFFYFFQQELKLELILAEPYFCPFQQACSRGCKRALDLRQTCCKKRIKENHDVVLYSKTNQTVTLVFKRRTSCLFICPQLFIKKERATKQEWNFQLSISAPPVWTVACFSMKSPWGCTLSPRE